VITAAGEAPRYGLVLAGAMGLQLNWSSDSKGCRRHSGRLTAHQQLLTRPHRDHLGGVSAASRVYGLFFFQPTLATPFKCGGAPQKVMYLAD